MKNKIKKCALVIGHKKESPGALNAKNGLTEFEFNNYLAKRIERRRIGVKIHRVYRQTYAALPGEINKLYPDFIVSLHCNAFNGNASGTEVIYYHRSKKGKQMAEILQDYLVSHLGLPDRGIKSSIVDNRGVYLLKNTKAPAVVAEPFFIDNDSDLLRAQEDLEGLAQAYANAINEIAILI
ncbi:MAG: N-acetylmuramoyl-L-alanine amidase [Candidatus Aminicenantes bacterium]|jgi:N-acetylmuramoyl-L-alanine amidase